MTDKQCTAIITAIYDLARVQNSLFPDSPYKIHSTELSRWEDATKEILDEDKDEADHIPNLAPILIKNYDKWIKEIEDKLETKIRNIKLPDYEWRLGLEQRISVIEVKHKSRDELYANNILRICERLNKLEQELARLDKGAANLLKSIDALQERADECDEYIQSADIEKWPKSLTWSELNSKTRPDKQPLTANDVYKKLEFETISFKQRIKNLLGMDSEDFAHRVRTKHIILATIKEILCNYKVEAKDE